MNARKFISALLALLLILSLTACAFTDDALYDDFFEDEDYYSGEYQSEAQYDSETQEPEDDYEDDIYDDADDDDGFEEFIEEIIGDEEDENVPTEEPEAAPEEEESTLPDEDGWYYSLEDVVLYLDAYGHLPSNFITKDEAEDLGWSGGPVDKYKEGAAIGGNRFGNREGLLPKADGRSYTECDIDTNGASSRGAKRLVFSNDGLYFYTDDHYESFTEVWVNNGEVEFK